jgi:hypothetical protein
LLETLFEDDTAWDFVEQPAEISPPGLDDLEEDARRAFA